MDINTAVEQLASSVEEMLREFSPDHHFNYGTVCIYKLPEKHRAKNESAFSPRVVSIGFVHHGLIHLQAMEKYKLKYLSHFLQTFRVPLKDLSEFVLDQQKHVLSYYEDVKDLNLNPGQVILLDAIFILDLFLKNHFLGMRENVDVVFGNPVISVDIVHDLLLLENQLPFPFLSALYDNFVLNSVRQNLDDYLPSFDILVHKFFMHVCGTGKLLLTPDLKHARHFVEFLSILHAPAPRDKLPMLRFLDRDYIKCKSAAELKAAGVRFKEGEKGSLNVHFDRNSGELEIPRLTVNKFTETFFHNLIAFEQSGDYKKSITSFVAFLGNLIKTHKDVDILIQNFIIINEISNENAALLFSNLLKDLEVSLVTQVDFHFIGISYMVDYYSRDRFHFLMGKYAESPLLKAAGFAALFTILLTLVSTVCSVLQVLGVGHI